MGDEKENDIIKLLKTIDNYYDKLIGEDITKDKTYKIRIDVKDDTAWERVRKVVFNEKEIKENQRRKIRINE